jgi:hypothetical protein
VPSAAGHEANPPTGSHTCGGEQAAEVLGAVAGVVEPEEGADHPELLIFFVLPPETGLRERRLEAGRHPCVVLRGTGQRCQVVPQMIRGLRQVGECEVTAENVGREG